MTFVIMYKRTSCSIVIPVECESLDKLKKEIRAAFNNKPKKRNGIIVFGKYLPLDSLINSKGEYVEPIILEFEEWTNKINEK